MGVRGPKSGAELAAGGLKVVPLNRRPSPWPGLGPREIELWSEIVQSKVADWFSAGDLPVLAAYCRAISLHERASAQCNGAPLTVFGPMGGEVVNPVFKVQDMAARQIASLAVKLRLTQSAKWTEQKAATKDRASGAKKLWDADQG